MKRKKGLLLLVVMMLFSMAVSVNAKVISKYNVYNVKEGTWSKKIEDWDYQYINGQYVNIFNVGKIVVPADGLVYFTSKNSDDSEIWLYETKELKGVAASPDFEKYTAIPKGTYYFALDKKEQFKFTFKKAVNKPNYSMNTALLLGKKKTVYVCNTYRHTYTRWYKVKLTQNQKITLFMEQGEKDGWDIYFYDSNGKEIERARNGKNIYTQKTLKKGTYYIAIRNDWDKVTIFYMK